MSFSLTHSSPHSELGSLGASNRGNHVTGPPEHDSLAVKRELENQDTAGAQQMFEVLNAVNRGQSQLPPSHFRPYIAPFSHLSHLVI